LAVAPIVTLLLIANFLNLGADLGAMGDALPPADRRPERFYVILFAAAAPPSRSFRATERYVKILKWMTLSLFAYVATALIVHVPWGEVAYDTIVPQMSWQKDYIVVIVAVAGHDDQPVSVLLAVFRGKPRTSASIPPRVR